MCVHFVPVCLGGLRRPFDYVCPAVHFVRTHCIMFEKFCHQFLSCLPMRIVSFVQFVCVTGSPRAHLQVVRMLGLCLT